MNNISKLTQIIEKEIVNKQVQLMCLALISTEAFQKAPAAMMMHHAYVGGLLSHTLEVVKIGLKIFEAIEHDEKDVLKDIFVAGAAFHDIGKILEYKWNDAKPTEVTNKGRLIGHIPMSFSIFEQYAGMFSIEGRYWEGIGHAIISHHGFVKDRGSPIAPKTLPAIVLHQADMISAFYGQTKDYPNPDEGIVKE